MSEWAFPVYEFRPLPGDFKGSFLRYADGAWIADDGEYDLAFMSADRTGPPMVYAVDVPYQKNIRWSWLSQRGNWGKREPKHPGENAWHYMLRSGEKDWGGSWNRDAYPCEKAKRDGMNKLAARRGCANGSGPCLNPDDPHILAGLVRERDSHTVLIVPDPLGCMYCKKTWTRER